MTAGHRDRASRLANQGETETLVRVVYWMARSMLNVRTPGTADEDREFEGPWAATAAHGETPREVHE